MVRTRYARIRKRVFCYHIRFLFLAAPAAFRPNTALHDAARFIPSLYIQQNQIKHKPFLQNHGPLNHGSYQVMGTTNP
ncbi:hypothetical protein DXC96_21535 [Enterocloster bolteae]|nr:hypothetical protein DXC96_21535 [Enterocloster bolteae]